MYAGFKNTLESISMETVALTNVARYYILKPNNQLIQSASSPNTSISKSLHSHGV